MSEIETARKESWHLDKRLSIGTIISLIVLGAGSVAAFTTVQNQLEHKADREQVAIVGTHVEYTRESIKRIEKIQEEILKEQRTLTRELRSQ